MSRAATHERLVDTAADLFYTRGFNVTGVDAVVAESGVSKPTLYAHFKSKDELARAVLERRRQHQIQTLDGWVRDHADTPRGRLLAVFDWLAGWHAEGAARGCAFLNAAVEIADPGHPVRALAREQKHWWRGYLAGLAAEAGVADAEQAGADLMLLIDGAHARVAVDGNLGAAAEAKRVAAVLLDAWGVRDDPAPRTHPATTDPASTRPASTDPASTGPASTGPASTGPASTGPAGTGPVGTGPVGTGPVGTGPVGGR
jgi:AcrR family transcriptional regulator